MSAKRGVYVVSKIGRASLWRGLRTYVPIVSTWIFDGGPGEIDFAEAWPRYLAEASNAIVCLVHVEEGQELKGGLLEIGAALAGGATVIVDGPVPALKTAQFHDRVILVNNLTEGIELARKVVDHYAADEDMQIEIAGFVVKSWGSQCLLDKKERAMRCLEEAFEIAQVSNIKSDDILAVWKWVYSRPVGEIQQEAAGLALTVLALAEAYGFDLTRVMRDELRRLQHVSLDKVRAKHLLKVEAGISSNFEAVA